MYDIGFQQACELARNNITPLGAEKIPVSGLSGRVCAREAIALIDYPSADSSLKDGYAVISRDIARADRQNPVLLQVVGTLGAGDPCTMSVSTGKTVRVLSGASIPEGAEAVLAEEFAEKRDGHIRALACSEQGRNILAKGSEVKEGEILVRTGEVFTPAKIGLIVAGGIQEAWVFRRPKVGLLATGNEVLLPGQPPETGKLFASNLALQDAWLRSWSISSVIEKAEDSFPGLKTALESIVDECDIILTSGGAWKGDRDLIVKVLDGLGWNMLFHRIRLGPGKAVALGFLQGKPVVCLPGGPPSNEAAFLLIALPLVLQLAGYTGSPYRRLTGILTEEVRGQKDWTQVVHCRAEKQDFSIRLVPLASTQRLRSMATADGLFLIPEGVEHISKGTLVEFICLNDQ
ncbi:molybdopterin molybdotransferase MoeA [Desulfomonile tiedjei]|uniref:Molybdopterin molybdenumtransferase n=1 Tax=Desulfomonile tiedjei (strain ATCC 49306 / DSM 6799 / DCB-1) TaxID=706587 RepID=I4CD84_DESTA|nr:molybdopterin molybdotransferase MoeA [Desulfomonile tiedjei]AFM27525.1 molybdopterin biosynthesis enzyme [Desulfomonile tiedjei DSM 6799]